MGNARFLYDNRITSESMISVSSLRTGMVTGAIKRGTGSAVLNPSGNYTETTDKEYIIEIDSIAAGAEVGQATFKWSAGGGGWNASGVITSATNITLNNGVTINWSSGSGDDFVVGDRWYLKGINLFNAGRMIDLDRDNRYRSAALESPNTITIDKLSAQEEKALVIFDHNLTSGATIALKENTANAWSTPAFSEGVTWNLEKMLHYLSAAQTYRYDQIQITDPSNPDGYIEISELFLGSYLELSKNFDNGYSRQINFLMDKNTTPYGVGKKRFYNQQSVFTFDFNDMPAADVTSMITLINAVSNRDTGLFNPFWFNPDSDVPNEFYLVEITSLPVNHSKLSYFNMPLELTEVVTSV